MVALLAEGVDRNIELLAAFLGYEVALLAEGVDRNRSTIMPVRSDGGRPPRRGRG